jgi:hypothetical protein
MCQAGVNFAHGLEAVLGKPLPNLWPPPRVDFTEVESPGSDFLHFALAAGTIQRSSER